MITPLLTLPSFAQLGPAEPTLPLLLTVPHAGRDYSAALMAGARVPLNVLRRLEDRLADLLITEAVAAGATALVAQAPRALIDLNRASDDMDPAQVAGEWPEARPSARALAGLGLAPHRLAPDGLLWRERVTAAQLRNRVASIHAPWHGRIEQLLSLAARRAVDGRAVLLDIHSMPPQGQGGPQIVIGDRFGLTASHSVSAGIAALAEQRGWRVSRNTPYAGAYALIRHGRAREGMAQAIQIEIDRRLYLTEDMRPEPVGLQQVRHFVAAAARFCCDGDARLLAAE